VLASMVPVLGSIANAIYDAVGIRMTELPITPQKILKALEEKRLTAETTGWVVGRTGNEPCGTSIPRCLAPLGTSIPRCLAPLLAPL